MCCKKLSQGGEEQEAALRFTHAETKRQRALRGDLRSTHMLPVSRIAKLVYGVPGMGPAFVMPKLRADNDSLSDAARGMAQAAARNSDVFTEHGLAKNFLDQFRAATSALSDALGARVESQRRRTVANKALTLYGDIGLSCYREEEMRIGEVASGAEVSIQTLRYYERRGLLPAPRRQMSGYRRYEHDAVTNSGRTWRGRAVPWRDARRRHSRASMRKSAT
jgi:hypothetical protein